MIAPTVGRVVWYRPVDGDGLVHYHDQPVLAWITAVHSDTCVNVVGFDANGTQYNRTSAWLAQSQEEVDHFKGQGLPYCEWMPYQIGQAKKTAELEAQTKGTQS